MGTGLRCRTCGVCNFCNGAFLFGRKFVPHIQAFNGMTGSDAQESQVGWLGENAGGWGFEPHPVYCRVSADFTAAAVMFPAKMRRRIGALCSKEMA